MPQTVRQAALHSSASSSTSSMTLAATEETPLLVGLPDDVERNSPLRKPTHRLAAAAAEDGEPGAALQESVPIPWRQLLTLCLVRLVDPICFSQIFPYINNMLLDMGIVPPNQPERVGFYSGLLESTFSVAVALAIYPWARLSDRIGRKPVLLYGVIGVTAAMVGFGMQTTFLMLLVARFIGGLSSGNSAAVHSLVGEMSDDSNAPRVFAIYGLCYPIGTMIGPLIGGLFANAPQKWPSVFHGDFWDKHPYAMPSFISAFLTLLSMLFGLLFLEETHPDKKPTHGPRRSSFSDQPPPTARNLLNIPVIRALFISGFFLCFISSAYDVVLVLFAFTPISLGGLGFSPQRIGYALAGAGVGGTFVSLVALPWILKRWSPGRVYGWSMAFWPFAFLVLPLTNFVARMGTGVQGEELRQRTDALIWLGLGLSLVLSKAACASFGCNMLLVRQSAPSANSLGATNGLVHLAINVARGISPWLTSALFALSTERNLLDGTLWVWLLIIMCIIGQRYAAKMPALEKPFVRIA